MDDDVKNLFQKFGQTNPAYQEINRTIESDQAKQRWPLLRDVQVLTRPDNIPQPVGEDKPVPLFRPAQAPVHKPVLKETQIVAPAPSPMPAPAPATSVNGGGHESKPLFMQPVAEVHQPAATPFSQTKESARQPASAAPAFRQNDAAEAQAKGSVFSPFARQPRQPEPEQPAAAPAQTSHRVVSPLFQPAVRSHQQNDADSGEKSLSSIFNRLAGSEEEVKANDTPVNSFFKKIFRP